MGKVIDGTYFSLAGGFIHFSKKVALALKIKAREESVSDKMLAPKNKPR